MLEAALQNKGPFPKWSNRVKIGLYVGPSTLHASSVGLVLNLATGHVNPQFHTVYDDDLTTVEDIARGSEPNTWRFLVKAQREISNGLPTEEEDNWHIHDETSEEGNEIPKDTQEESMLVKLKLCSLNLPSLQSERVSKIYPIFPKASSGLMSSQKGETAIFEGESVSISEVSGDGEKGNGTALSVDEGDRLNNQERGLLIDLNKSGLCS